MALTLRGTWSELDNLVLKWGKGGAINQSAVDAEEDRFECCEQSGQSMAANIWTGTEACSRKPRPAKVPKTPSQMNREELEEAVLNDATAKGYTLEGRRVRRPRVISDASDLAHGMGQARHF